MHKARQTVIALAALAALASQAPAGAAPASAGHRAGCATTMTFLVWPHGHPAIARIGFADMTTPHLEIYKGAGSGYDFSGFLAWAAGGKTSEPSPSTSPSCLSYTTLPKAPKPLGKMRTIARTAAVTCAFPASGLIDIQKAGGGANRYRVRILLSGGRLGAQGEIGPAGVTLRYPSALCHVRAAPAP